MIPLSFPEQSQVMKGNDCLDLPAHVSMVQIGDRIMWQTVTCWKPTEDELSDLLTGKCLWMRVMAAPTPPVWVGTESPFPKECGGN